MIELYKINSIYQIMINFNKPQVLLWRRGELNLPRNPDRRGSQKRGDKRNMHKDRELHWIGTHKNITSIQTGD